MTKNCFKYAAAREIDAKNTALKLPWCRYAFLSMKREVLIEGYWPFCSIITYPLILLCFGDEISFHWVNLLMRLVSFSQWIGTAAKGKVKLQRGNDLQIAPLLQLPYVFLKLVFFNQTMFRDVNNSSWSCGKNTPLDSGAISVLVPRPHKLKQPWIDKLMQNDFAST